MLAVETGWFVFAAFRQVPILGFAVAEVRCWENAMTFDAGQLDLFLAKLVEMTSVG